MGVETLRGFLFCCLLAASPIGCSLPSSPGPAGVEIIVERNERVSRDEARHRLRVTNRSDRPVFLAGINYESGPSLYPVYLEQWRQKEGWKTVVPCLDTPPPDVIKLNPGEAMTLDLVLEVPLSGVCKQRNIQLEGRFRFRLEYFESEKQARTYVEKLFSRRWQEAWAPVAVSKPFEIPPPANAED